MVILAMVKVPYRGFSDSLKILRLADLKLNKLKAALNWPTFALSECFYSSCLYSSVFYTCLVHFCANKQLFSM